MGYEIECIIGKIECLNEIKRINDKIEIIYLYEDLYIIPMESDGNSNKESGIRGTYNLTEEIEKTLKNISIIDKVGYFAAEYFAGEGGQSAIIYHNGNIIFESTSNANHATNEPINSALILLGIKQNKKTDLFTEVGFYKFRNWHRSNR